MTTTRAATTAALHTALAKSGRPYPAELRARIIEFARAEKSAGVPVRRTAAALGLHEITLGTWLRADTNFRPVAIVPDRAPFEIVRARGDAAIRVVHSASGLVVEGLDVADVAELLRRLG